MPSVEKVFLGLAELILRVIPAAIFVSVVFFLWSLGAYYFEGVGVHTQSTGAQTQVPLTGAVVKKASIEAWRVFLIVFSGNFLLECLISMASTKVQRAKIFLLRKLKVPSLLIDHLKNTTTISVTELDEFVRGIYDRSQGTIILYNPDAEMFKNAASPVRAAVVKKLKDNSITELKIEVSTANLSIFEKFRSELEERIRGGVEIFVDPVLDSVSSSHLDRRATYFASAGPGIYDVYYFMYRPVRWPYNDKYVIIKRGKDLKGLQYKTRNLHAVVSGC